MRRLRSCAGSFQGRCRVEAGGTADPAGRVSERLEGVWGAIAVPTPHGDPSGQSGQTEPVEKYFNRSCGGGMASITLKHIPEHLHAMLKNEAEANYRKVEQEVMARLERSLDLDAATRRDQKWIDEALASGSEESFSKEKFTKALKRGLTKANSKRR